MLVGPFYWLGKMSDHYTLLELYETYGDEFAGMNDYEERCSQEQPKRDNVL